MANGLEVMDMVVGTPSKNFIRIDAYDLTNSDSNPWVNVVSVVNNISQKISGDKSNLENNFDFDEESLIGYISKGFSSSGEISKDMLKASNVALDYLHTGGEIDPKTLKASWVLPLPNNLVNAISHNYSESTSGIDSFLKMNLKGSGNKEDENKNEGRFKKFSNWAGRTSLLGVSNTIASSATTFAKSLKRFNMNIDQKVITTYGDTDIRSFNFEFNLIPYNKTHSDLIFKSILSLKKFMTGNIMDDSGSMFIHQPTAFTLSFGSKDSEANVGISQQLSQLLLLNSNMELNLTSIRTSYLSNNIPLIKGFPKSLTFGLSFSERRPYRRDFFVKKEKK